MPEHPLLTALIYQHVLNMVTTCKGLGGPWSVVWTHAVAKGTGCGLDASAVAVYARRHGMWVFVFFLFLFFFFFL